MARNCIIILVNITFLLSYGNVTVENKIIYPSRSQQPEEENNRNGLCLVITECKSLLFLYKLSYRNLDYFNVCGFDRNTKLPMYRCPTKKDSIVLNNDIKKSQSNSVCNCKNVDQCPILKKLVQERRFRDLRKTESCGFQGKNSKYCCPRDDDSFRNDSETKHNKITLKGSMTEICGYQNLLRVVGGQNSDPHEYPWAALLEYQKHKTNLKVSLCGGVLISPLHILTAAHCIKDAEEKGYKLVAVRMGHANIKHKSSFSLKIANAIVHPDYKRVNPFVINDIAIVNLQKAVQFDNTVRPICLPNPVSITEEGRTILVGTYLI